MPKTKEYIRLPGKKRRLLGYDTLWLGRDHLLAVNFSGFSEEYKRFYYKDIQVISTQKDARWVIFNIVLGSLTGILFLISFRLWEESGIFLATVGWFFPLYFLINLLRGPTCRCYIRTAIRTEELPSLNRLRTARKALRILIPLIEGVQGKVTREALQAKASAAFHEAAFNVTPQIDPTRANSEAGYDHGRFHEILFCLLLLDGVLTSVDLFYNHIAITLSAMVLSLALGICVITALVRQQGSPLTKTLRAITWGTLAYSCAYFFIGYVYYLFIAFRNPEIMNNQWEVIKLISVQSPSDFSLLAGAYIFSIVCSFSLGLSGLILLKMPRHEYSVSQPVSSGSSAGQSAVLRK